MNAEIQDHIAAVRAQLVDMLRTSTGSDEITAFKMASQVMTLLLDELAGVKIYIPKRTAYDRDAIIDDIKSRKPVRDICRRHGIGKKTYYRLQRESWG